MIARLALVLASAAAAPIGAQERSLVIESFAATIKVNPDASLDITEEIAPRFMGQWNGIYRAIPIEYRTAQGFNWAIRLKLVSATDETGRALKTEMDRERHYLKFRIYIPDARDATRHVVLKYRVENGLRFFPDHDELYWNVTGDEWEVLIGQATARIELPTGAGNVRAIAFNGAYGSTAQDATVSTEGSAVQITLPHALNFHEGLTAVVGWNKGAVAEPSQSDRVLGFLAVNWALLIPIPVFFGMYSIWNKRGRDPKRLPIAVQYGPPDGLTPAEAGTLIDNSADMRDITATLVDLAVRGYLRIDEREESKLFGLFKDKDFVFHRLTPASPARPIAPHEQAVLDGIFRFGEQSVELSSLQNQFYKAIPEVKDAIFDRLIGHTFYRSRPDRVQGGWIAGGIFLGVAIGVGGSALADYRGLSPLAFIVAGLLTALIMVAFGYFMPARTLAGARALEKVLGFEEFLSRVEGDRLERVVKTPELFETCLPYAMAFGVEKQWSKAFADIYTTPPTWYAGSNFGAFNAASFSDRLSTMSTRAASTLSSAPRSSSGSGFSGGSSGGGGGGGGGGGF
jgi:uncharacterized membrane protein